LGFVSSMGKWKLENVPYQENKKGLTEEMSTKRGTKFSIGRKLFSLNQAAN